MPQRLTLRNELEHFIEHPEEPFDLELLMVFVLLVSLAALVAWFIIALNNPGLRDERPAGKSASSIHISYLTQPVQSSDPPPEPVIC